MSKSGGSIQGNKVIHQTAEDQEHVLGPRVTPEALLEVESLGDKVCGFMELNIRNIENKYFHTIVLFLWGCTGCSPSINHGS